MKKNFRPVMWKISIMNTKTGKVSYRKVKKTYDGVTAFVKKLRNKNKYNSVCAEEMDKHGKETLTVGRSVALDSRADEKLFRDSMTVDVFDKDEDMWDLWDEM